MNCTHAESETLTLMDVTSNPSIIVSMQEEKKKEESLHSMSGCKS
jgi:transaldolase